MAIGMIGSYSDLLDQPPLTLVSKNLHKREFTPTNNILIYEIYRRVHFLVVVDPDDYAKRGEQHPFGTRLVPPRPNGWKRHEMIHWLETHCITSQEQDLAFIESRISQYKRNLVEAMLEDSACKSNNETFWERKGWQNLGYRCRFINVITSDEM
jgi:hypothetical protein